MKDIWTISKEDAFEMCAFLERYIYDWPNSFETKCIRRVYEALMWADRIEIED